MIFLSPPHTVCDNLLRYLILIVHDRTLGIPILHPCILILTKLKRWTVNRTSSWPKAKAKRDTDWADIKYLIAWLSDKDHKIEFNKYEGKGRGDLLVMVRQVHHELIEEEDEELLVKLEEVMHPVDWEDMSIIVLAPTVEDPTPIVIVTTPSVDVPTPTTNVPTPSMDVPTSPVDAPISTVVVDVPTPTVDVPTPTADVPTSTVENPTPTVDVPTPAVDALTSKVDVPTSTVEVPTTTVDGPTPTPEEGMTG